MVEFLIKMNLQRAYQIDQYVILNNVLQIIHMVNIKLNINITYEYLA